MRGAKNNRDGRISQIYIILVAGALALGGIGLLVLPQSRYSEMENRYLSTMPDVTAEGIFSGEVQRGLTEMASDQLPGREQWVRTAATAKFMLFHREVNGVYIGQADYLSDGTDRYMIEKTLDSDLSIENYEKNLRFITAMKRDTGADVSVMLIPSPGTMLPDRLPKRAVYYDSTPFESAGSEICEADSVRWIETRSALERAVHGRTRQVYFRTDHHWTAYGAYTGASVYLRSQDREPAAWEEYGARAASDEFYGTLYAKAAGVPGIAPDELELPTRLPEGISVVADAPPADSPDVDGEKVMPELDGIYARGKLGTRDKYAVYFGGNYAKITIENPGAGDRSLLMFKDSYANSMAPYLLDYYGRITMVDLRYFNGSVPELAGGGWDEILVCYEMGNFIKDKNMFKLIR